MFADVRMSLLIAFFLPGRPRALSHRQISTMRDHTVVEAEPHAHMSFTGEEHGRGRQSDSGEGPSGVGRRWATAGTPLYFGLTPVHRGNGLAGRLAPSAGRPSPRRESVYSTGCSTEKGGPQWCSIWRAANLTC